VGQDLLERFKAALGPGQEPSGERPANVRQASGERPAPPDPDLLKRFQQYVPEASVGGLARRFAGDFLSGVGQTMRFPEQALNMPGVAEHQGLVTTPLRALAGGLGQAGRAVEGLGQQVQPERPQGFAGDVAGTVGSALSFAVPGMAISRGLAISGELTSAALGIMQNGAQGWIEAMAATGDHQAAQFAADQARAAGASPSDVDRAYQDVIEQTGDRDMAAKALLLNGAVGITETVGLGDVIGRADVASHGEVGKAIAKMVMEETAQEGFQQYAQNVGAYLIGYDKDRQFMDGVLKAGALGGIGGFLVGGPLEYVAHAQAQQQEQAGAEGGGTGNNLDQGLTPPVEAPAVAQPEALGEQGQPLVAEGSVPETAPPVEPEQGAAPEAPMEPESPVETPAVADEEALPSSEGINPPGEPMPTASATLTGEPAAPSLPSGEVVGSRRAEEPSVPAQEEGAAPPSTAPVAPEQHGLALAFEAGLAGDEDLSNARKVREFAERHGYGVRTAKELDEAVEHAVVRRARAIVAEGLPEQETFDRLLELYKRQPKLESRTSTSKALQAYSTPVPISFVAARLAGIEEHTRVYEPTAGNGSLLITAGLGTTQANELDPRRAANLQALGFTPTVQDALSLEHRPQRADVVIANPPFGVVAGEGGQRHRIFNGKIGTVPYVTKQIDRAIAARALGVMRSNGRAVLILGGKKPFGDQSQDARTRQYRSLEDQGFWKAVYGQYNVVDHFTVDGKLYDRQGAAWPIDVVVIHGRRGEGGNQVLPMPFKEAPRVLGSWEALREQLLNVDRVVPAGDRSGPDLGVGPEGAGGEHGAVEPAAVPGPAEGAPPRSDGEPGRGRDEGAPAGGVRAPRGDRGERDHPGAGERDVDVAGVPGAAEPVDADVAVERPVADEGATDERPARGESAGERGAPGLAEPGDAGSPRALERVNEFQATYQPQSKANAIGTLVPANMQTAIDRALARVEKETGKKVDEYVAEKLGYTREELPGHFAAEQVDAIALAISNLDKRGGFIIGDQTGVGKGRVVAAVLRYATRTGKIPVFVTAKPALFVDMRRDLADIGMPGFRQFVTNTDLRGEKRLPLRSGEMIETLPAAEYEKAMEVFAKAAEAGKQHPDFDAIFTTYDQMNPAKGEETKRNAFMRRVAPNAILVMDESHKAGGTEQKGFFTDKSGDPITKASRSDFFRDLVDAAAGVLYSSATYAKNPHVMSLYTRTNMGLAVDDRSKLPDLIRHGGVPLQQAVATMLSDDGQYIRREKSFDGISMEMRAAKVERAAADRATGFVRDIFRFDLLMKPIRERFGQSTAGGGGGVRTGDSGVGSGGAEQGGFSSVMHNVIAQMLLSLKAREVGQQAVETFKSGKKPVIALANTMEGLLKDEVADAGLKVGDVLDDYTFAKSFARYLKRTRTVTIKESQGAKGVRHYITDEEMAEAGGGHLLAAFDGLLDGIERAELGDMPAAPLDAMIAEMQRGGMRVGEITGRELRVDYQPDGSAIVAKREDSQSIKTRSMREFNDGALDALVINQSGAEGFSLHASPKNGKDVRPRHMFLVQADPNVDVLMQLLGRINRTGQTELPGYEFVVSDLPSEKRPAAITMKKMGSLNANTSANKDSAVSLKGAVDFMNVYGDQAVKEVLEGEPELAAAIGFDQDVIDREFKAENLARRATGYFPMLEIADQERLLEAIENNYTMRLEEAQARGENLLEAATQDLRATTVSSTELVPGHEGSEFSKPAMLEQVMATRAYKPMTWDAIRAKERLLANAEEGTDNTQARYKAAGDMDTRLKDAAEEVRAKLQGEHRRLKAELPEGAPAGHPIHAQLKAVEKRWTKQSLNADAIRQRINLLRTGSVTMETADERTPAYVVGIEAPKKGNLLAPSNWSVVLAPVGSDRFVRIAVSRLMAAADPKADGYVALTDLRHGVGPEDFTGKATETRERRWIVTGNLLSGFAKMGGHGQITFYTDDKGHVRQGILLKRSANPGEILAGKPVYMSGAHAVELVDRLGTYVKTEDGLLTISSQGPGHALTLVANNKGGKGYYLSSAARAALGGDFESRRGNKEWVFSTNDRKAVKKALAIYERDLGAKFLTTEHQAEARKITGEKAVDLDSPSIVGMHAGPPLPTGIIPLSAVKAWFQKHMTWHGNTPESGARELELAHGEVEAELNEVAQRARELDRAVAAAFGKGWRVQPIAGRIDAAFRDAELLEKLPDAIQRPLAAMRAHVDRMTRLMLQAGAVDPESKLAEIMLGNLGTYLKREYRAFSNVEWADKVPENIKQRFVSMLVAEGKSEEDAHGIMEAILQEAKESAANPFRQLSSSKLGSKDLSIFKRRKDLPVELRDLLGEIKDPLANYANSVMRMANIVARHKAYTAIRELGLDAGWLSEPGSRAPGHSATISKEGNPALGPLDGMHTTPDVKEALTQIGPKESALYLKLLMRANSSIKWAKVIGQPTAFARNLASNVTLSIANGHLPTWTKLEAWKLAFGGGELEERKKLIRLRVIDESINAYEWNDYRNSLRLSPDEMLKAQSGLFERVKGGIERAYTAADNMPKIMGFYAERQHLIEAGYGKHTAEELAADRTSNLYPTPARMAQLAKTYRGQPFLGQYFAFKAELVRTLARRLELIGEELKSKNPAVRAMGLRRIAGQVVAAGLTPAAVILWNMLNGIDRDEDEKRRQFMPEWDADNEVLWKGDSLKGEYVDLSDIDPLTNFTDPMFRVLGGARPREAMLHWLGDQGRTFFGPSPISQLIVDAYTRHTRDGIPIDNMGEHVLKEVQPGVVAWAEREAKDGFDAGSLASFALARPYPYDVERSLSFDIQRFARGKSESTEVANRQIRHGSDKPARRADQEDERRALYAELGSKVAAASSLGMNRKRIEQMLDERLSREDTTAILSGVYIPFREPRPKRPERPITQ